MFIATWFVLCLLYGVLPPLCTSVNHHSVPETLINNRWYKVDNIRWMLTKGQDKWKIEMQAELEGSSTIAKWQSSFSCWHWFEFRLFFSRPKMFAWLLDFLLWHLFLNEMSYSVAKSGGHWVGWAGHSYSITSNKTYWIKSNWI